MHKTIPALLLFGVFAFSGSAVAQQEEQADQNRSSADSADAIAGVIPRTPENIARLGADLTPMGAPKAGNADGTIPAWDGGLTEADWPEGYEPGGYYLDPFADDEVRLRISAENIEDHSEYLSVGQRAIFERYPESFFMNVYPTRRSASFPERIYEMTRQNADTGQLIAGGEGVADVAEGTPFPIPQNAAELIWNHKLKYKTAGTVRYWNQVVPTASGNYTLIRMREEILGLYFKQGMTIDGVDNVLAYFFQEVESPARLAGNILLVHESLNQIEKPRQAWVYNPGQRRVRRAPNVAYDNPGTASDGQRTSDMTDMFNGALDRYDWKLVGKREMYVPYNSYKVHSDQLKYDDILQPGHIDPDLLRYELHRVWVVDATLKAMGGIGMETVVAGLASQGHRFKPGGLQYQVTGFFRNSGMLTAHHTGDRQKLLMIRNHQCIRSQFDSLAIQQYQLFIVPRHADHNATVDFFPVEGVQGLTQLQHDIVGNINGGVNGADTAATQLLDHPQGGLNREIDVANNPAQITGTGGRRFHCNGRPVIMRGRYR